MRGERDVGKLRRWCVRRLLEGWSIRDISAHAMMPKSTVHDWWMRFQRKGWAGLVNESKRPHVIHRLPEETVARVIEVRQREGWCGEAIAAYLNQQESIMVSSGSVYKVLKESKLITRTYKPRMQRTYIRFQRTHPDSLWQTDIKYYGLQYLIAYLDDCSRYLPAIELYTEATTENLLNLRDYALSHPNSTATTARAGSRYTWSRMGSNTLWVPLENPQRKARSNASSKPSSYTTTIQRPEPIQRILQQQSSMPRAQ